MDDLRIHSWAVSQDECISPLLERHAEAQHARTFVSVDGCRSPNVHQPRCARDGREDASYGDEIRTERDMLLVTMPSLMYQFDNCSQQYSFTLSISPSTNTYVWIVATRLPRASRLDPSLRQWMQSWLPVRVPSLVTGLIARPGITSKATDWLPSARCSETGLFGCSAANMLAIPCRSQRRLRIEINSVKLTPLMHGKSRVLF